MFCAPLCRETQEKDLKHTEADLGADRISAARHNTVFFFARPTLLIQHQVWSIEVFLLQFLTLCEKQSASCEQNDKYLNTVDSTTF